MERRKEWGDEREGRRKQEGKGEDKGMRRVRTKRREERGI